METVVVKADNSQWIQGNIRTCQDALYPFVFHQDKPEFLVKLLPPQKINTVIADIGVVEMREESYFEIDELFDWTIIEKFLADRKTATLTKHKIKMVLTDCDGCLTDGGMYYSDSGSECKKFNTKDGMGFQLLRERGIKTGIITGKIIH